MNRITTRIVVRLFVAVASPTVAHADDWALFNACPKQTFEAIDGELFVHGGVHLGCNMKDAVPVVCSPGKLRWICLTPFESSHVVGQGKDVTVIDEGGTSDNFGMLPINDEDGNPRIPPRFKTCVPSKIRWGCAPPSCIDPETGLTRMEDEKFVCDGHDFGRAR